MAPRLVSPGALVEVNNALNPSCCRHCRCRYRYRYRYYGGRKHRVRRKPAHALSGRVPAARGMLALRRKDTNRNRWKRRNLLRSMRVHAGASARQLWHKFMYDV